ncbi:MFS transporter [Streptomyces phaeoluteigriseus]|uniref:MFS transporter n=1 Tax=Streptomyces phaeoluteigriseus TaxID=114686 RepID=A0ABY4Z6X0_9ACTN|nr:MFS transporter [Streptomyces phaeoluteigriseus]USQ84420.1 MFS transporter [Streptomyces phaeoluteigriseus]
MNRPLTLASSVAGAMVVALDGTVLTVAQPTLQRDLDASFAQVQWTSTGYLIAVASLLVFAGRLGDRYGHRRTFAFGMLGFGAASVGVALAPGVGWVIGLRVVQGVFGALLQPATLGMLRAAYPAEALRRPIAARTAAIGLAAAAGPVLGGALTTGVGWRSVFLLNVVPALLFGTLALGGGKRSRATTSSAPQTPSETATESGTATSLDIPGALWLAVALACLVHALVTPSGPAGALGAVAAVVAGAGFVRHERRAPAPLLPPGVVGSPAIGAALALLVTVSAALNGGLFACVYVLQDDLGLTPLHTALVSLPLAASLVAAAPVSAVLLRRSGARSTVAGATAVLASGLLVLAAAPGTAVFSTGFALVGAGFGTVMVAATHVVVRKSPVESAGVAGGLQQTAMNVGPVLGVASATVLMGAAGTRSPLVVLAVAAVTALPFCRALPGPRPVAPGLPAAVPAAAPDPLGRPVPAGRSDAQHIVGAVERGSFGPCLRDDGV